MVIQIDNVDIKQVDQAPTSVAQVSELSFDLCRQANFESI